jgi:hypothetical protein
VYLTHPSVQLEARVECNSEESIPVHLHFQLKPILGFVVEGLGEPKSVLVLHQKTSHLLFEQCTDKE